MTPDELMDVAQGLQEKDAKTPNHVRVCTAASCLSLKSDDLAKEIKKELKEVGKDKETKVRCVGCMGLCSAGPLVSVESQDQEPVMYQNVTVDNASQIAKSVASGSKIEELVCDTKIPFFARQEKIVLENSGVIDADDINDYIANDGYQALMTAISEMQPNEVLDEITKSGLRGRGGAGFPTGLKWNMLAKTPSDTKYIICNADEGDPGAFMDRAILESDPHRILEGMALAAYATGATEGFIYVRAEYPLAIKRLKTAIRLATKNNFLGSTIGGTKFSFTIDIRLGAGAFVCGEETALIASIEGKRGQPRPRPPFPAEKGLWGKPTSINNVETLANIAPIVRKGGEWFAGIGTNKSKGTKVFALAGKINNTGLIEVPMGLTLRDIVFDIGGGIPDGQEFKAVQTGGPSGGCLPEEHLDMGVDYDSLRTAGSIMGSGGMIIMDQTSNMVDVARFFMEFCMSESCGKCIPCRVGTYQMHELLNRIAEGEGTTDDLAKLEELCDVVANTSLCGLGQTSPNPVRSTLRYFRHEYLELIDGKHIPAGAGQEVAS
ncbi:MAG TPA: NADH-quinone oxidoreductase subunit L [Phycisphaerales bacterium]|nr:NADH-quinone oxidoreductase subunit L [Phycisphaerales bacterium]|tara:strand:- start:57960 stop:59606 length:1647 start_codon:yes stop_codon:yes gene_type:complete